MLDETPLTDPEIIAAYVRSARIVYGFGDDQYNPGEIDNPPIVVPTVDGAKVRAWLPVAALSRNDEIELDERRRQDDSERRSRGAGLAAGLGRRHLGLEGRGAYRLAAESDPLACHPPSFGPRPESAWHDDHRQMSNGDQFKAIAGLVAKNKPSVDFCGYWQRSSAA